jgi:DNA processing protein
MQKTAPLRLTLDGPSYPTRLAAIEGAPTSLWLRGRAELLEAGRRRVALVGSRSPTPYGTAQALRFGAALAGAGTVVVSGLARGVDQAAHRGALEAGGDTIAVLGSGVSNPWPPTPLTQELVTRGLLVSEFEPEEGPRRHHFPLRNRVISGLCDAVLVVEAAEASGSLITARWAVDQGREVFALPGRVDHPMSRGAHKLIREGARLVESPEELLAELYPQLASPSPARECLVESPLEGALRGETLSADELAERLERPVRSVLCELVTLEVGGRVVRTPGGLYRLGVGGR